MTFLPSFLMISISYATSFFRLPNFFNTAITVNLTVMLTVTTLLISVVNKLSQTSYIKWIEGWLIFAQLVPFTQVILITVIERAKEGDGKVCVQEKRKVQPFAQPKKQTTVDIVRVATFIEMIVVPTSVGVAFC